MNKIIEIKKFARKNLDGFRYIHTKDVVNTALTLAKEEKANKNIIEISAWLHDIGLVDKNAKVIDHHLFSIKIANGLLKKLNFEKEEIDVILNCITEHMGPFKSKFFSKLLKEEGKNWNFLPRPSTKESKILYDADMINLLSPFGVAKLIFLRAKSNVDFINAVKDTKIIILQAFKDLKTKSGKKMGKKYYAESKRFLDGIGLS